MTGATLSTAGPKHHCCGERGGTETQRPPERQTNNGVAVVGRTQMVGHVCSMLPPSPTSNSPWCARPYTHPRSDIPSSRWPHCPPSHTPITSGTFHLTRFLRGPSCCCDNPTNTDPRTANRRSCGNEPCCLCAVHGKAPGSQHSAA